MRVPRQREAAGLDAVRRRQWAPALPTEERRGDRLAFVDGRAANDEPGSLRRPEARLVMSSPPSDADAHQGSGAQPAAAHRRQKLNRDLAAKVPTLDTEA